MNAIKNVPAATILQINLKNVKKNLQIKSMIYNFILVLSMLELGAAAVWGLSNILIYYTPYNLKDFNISNQSPEFTYTNTPHAKYRYDSSHLNPSNNVSISNRFKESVPRLSL